MPPKTTPADKPTEALDPATGEAVQDADTQQPADTATPNPVTPPESSPQDTATADTPETVEATISVISDDTLIDDAISVVTHLVKRVTDAAITVDQVLTFSLSRNGRVVVVTTDGRKIEAQLK